MTNRLIKNALGTGIPSINNEIELLDSELDEVAGGACQSFTCGVYKVV